MDMRILKILFLSLFILMSEGVSSTEPQPYNYSVELHEIFKDLAVVTDALKSITYLKARGPRPKCEVSVDKVHEMKETVDQALKNITVGNEPANCEYDEDFESDNCEEMFKLIQCGLSHLIQAFAESDQSSLAEIQRLQTALEQLKDQFEKELNDLQSSMEEEFLGKLEKLQRDLDNLTLRFNELVEKIKIQNIELCVYQIFNDHQEVAANLYSTEINDHNELSKIIPKTYNMLPGGETDSSKRIANFDKIVKFLNLLKGNIVKLLGLEHLEDVMDDNGHHSKDSELLSMRIDLQSKLKCRNMDIPIFEDDHTIVVKQLKIFQE